jgi:hypothetical protein
MLSVLDYSARTECQFFLVHPTLPLDPGNAVFMDIIIGDNPGVCRE